MPITKEIKCRCGRNSIVDVELATAYIKITSFMCDCGRSYHIRDYRNGITSYSQITTKEYDDFLCVIEEEKKKNKKRNPTEDGRRKYQAVDKWLMVQSVETIAGIEAQRTFHQLTDRSFVIETLLEHCRYEDDLLDELYEQYLLSLMCPVVSWIAETQYSTDKRDWYVLRLVERVSPEFSRPYDSETEVKEVIDKMKTMEEYKQDAFTYFSAKKGADIKLPEVQKN